MADETRERILDGTLKLLQGRALKEFNMEQLADYIGVTRKTIYNHFSGKAELVSEAIATGMDRIVRTLTTIAEDSSLGFVEKLDHIVERGFRETKQLWIPETRAMGVRSPMEIQGTVRELNDHIRELIERIVTEAASSGLFADEVEPGIYAHVILNIINGIRCIDDPDALPVPPLDLLRESLRVCIAGALSPRGAATLSGSSILSARGGVS